MCGFAWGWEEASLAAKVVCWPETARKERTVAKREMRVRRQRSQGMTAEWMLFADADAEEGAQTGVEGLCQESAMVEG